MKFSLFLVMQGAIFFSVNSYAFTDCSRPMGDVWNSMGGDKGVWVTFTDGGGAIYKNGDQITSDQMNRSFSQALTAKISGKRLSVRYPEDNISCPPPVGVNRNDIQGIWITD